MTWSAFGPTLFFRVLIWLPSLPDHCRSRPLPFACESAGEASALVAAAAASPEPVKESLSGSAAAARFCLSARTSNPASSSDTCACKGMSPALSLKFHHYIEYAKS